MNEFLFLLKDFILGVFMFLLLEAGKHIKKGDFSLLVFFEDNVRPLMWSIALGIISTAVMGFFPEYIPFIKGSPDLDIGWANVLLSGVGVGGLAKSIIGGGGHKKPDRVVNSIIGGGGHKRPD